MSVECVFISLGDPMLRYALLIVFLGCGFALWIALGPVEQTSPRAKKAPSAATAGEETPPETRPEASPAKAKAKTKAATPRRWGKAAKPSRPPPPVVRNALPRGSAKRVQWKTAPAPPTTAPRAPVAAPEDKSGWGRMTRGGSMPKYQAGPLKDGIRRYYANLPRSGGVPSTIRLDELFADDLVETLNLPPECRVTEIGSWSATSADAFKRALSSVPDDGQGTLGFTCEYEGRSYREYIASAP